MKIYKKVARLRAQTSTPNKSTDPGGICQTRDFKVLSSGLKNILKKKKKKKKKGYDQTQISRSPIGIDSMIKVRGRLWL